MTRALKNCLIAQSGGPTSVVNASAYGCISEFLSKGDGGTAYAGMFGIEGVLKGKLSDAGRLSGRQLEALKFMPSSAFGSNRYKLKDYTKDDTDYKKLIKILDKLEIGCFFYIGGNDSMDTACRVDAYAKSIGRELNVIGVPKTIDNDLEGTDHCPGFGSAAKFVSNAALEMWYDINTYHKTSVMVMEVMGRDAGWIAASTGIISSAAPDINQMILLPERPFDDEQFINDAKGALSRNNKLLIVASEGLRNSLGSYVGQADTCYESDVFGHRQLGGSGSHLRSLIKRHITNDVKLTELGVIQRCSLHCVSKTDRDEAEMSGRAAVRYALDGASGCMAALTRESVKSGEYRCGTRLVALDSVRNKIRVVPAEWISADGTGVTDEMRGYVAPLIAGEIDSFGSNGLLRYNPVDIFRNVDVKME